VPDRRDAGAQCCARKEAKGHFLDPEAERLPMAALVLERNTTIADAASTLN